VDDKKRFFGFMWILAYPNTRDTKTFQDRTSKAMPA
jgi:hypothetical protein